jgi:hypothetical protein
MRRTAKPRLILFSGTPAHFLHFVHVTRGPSEPIPETIGVVRFNKDASDPVLDDLGERSDAAGDDWRARRIRLEHCQRESLEPD